jgi:hypothetical protein
LSDQQAAGSCKALAKIKTKQTGEMELTISRMGVVENWRMLLRQQTHVWPSYGLGNELVRVLGHITGSTGTEFSDSPSFLCTKR